MAPFHYSPVLVLAVWHLDPSLGRREGWACPRASLAGGGGCGAGGRLVSQTMPVQAARTGHLLGHQWFWTVCVLVVDGLLPVCLTESEKRPLQAVFNFPSGFPVEEAACPSRS